MINRILNILAVFIAAIAMSFVLWVAVKLIQSKPTHIIHDTHTLATCERWMFIQGKSITTMTIETRDTLIFETRELSLTEYKSK